MTDTNTAPAHPSRLRSWIEAMRLRTLPVSVAGVIAGVAMALAAGRCLLLPALICLVFALVAQIASNFANEYYDYRNGLDRKGRAGFRRGVTEGDIRPQTMKRATYSLIALDAFLGLSLIWWGGWWLIIPGVLVFLFAVGYSTGPYPLSHHGLGDIAVIIFFGIVPVMLTAYVCSGVWLWTPWLPVGIAVGLMAANVLIINNYRDADDDRAVGKRTTVVIFGRPAMAAAYLCFGIAGAVLPVVTIRNTGGLIVLPSVIYAVLCIRIYSAMKSSSGSALNPLLGRTAKNLLLFAVLLLAVIIFDILRL